jgi:hypothetical protein
MRTVSVVSIGLLSPGGIGPDGAQGGSKGEVPGFRARAYIQNRKNLKLMSRAVKLGVSAIRLGLVDAGDVDAVPPVRRGMFVGSTPLGGEGSDLLPALDVATDADGQLDLGRFAREGYALIHPLWLIKGLSNNVLGFASAIHDFQGVNANYCDGPDSGAHALGEGWAAVAEDRADLVVAGASDSWVGLEQLIGGKGVGEGAAFFVLAPGDQGPWVLEQAPGPVDLDLEGPAMGFLGAAHEVVPFARAAMRGETRTVSTSAGLLRVRRVC